MLPFPSGYRLCYGFCPVDLIFQPTELASKIRTGIAGIVLAGLLFLNIGCQPSDEDVARAAEESISNLGRVAVANLKCSVEEALQGGSQATQTMEDFSTRMEKLTDTLENDTTASNREKMRVINEINDLQGDWEERLEEIGCEVSDL